MTGDVGWTPLGEVVEQLLLGLMTGAREESILTGSFTPPWRGASALGAPAYRSAGGTDAAIGMGKKDGPEPAQFREETNTNGGNVFVFIKPATGRHGFAHRAKI